MANSVVKVTENAANDAFLVVIGADGTVSPSRETMEAYLSSRTGEETDIQVMQIKQSDGKSMDVTLDTLTYVASHEEEGLYTPQEMDEISRNLHNFRMDHDYTPLTSPRRDNTIIEDVVEEEDELAHTLSILEGNVLPSRSLPPPPPAPRPKTFAKVIKKVTPQASVIRTISAPIVTSVSAKPTRLKVAAQPKPIEPEDYADDDYELDSEESDTNDSDFELEKPIEKPKSLPKKIRTKLPEPQKVKLIQTVEKQKVVTVASKPEPEPARKEEAIENKTPDKKILPKKDKKAPKPPDDFALFSTPDIIRRVGGNKQESLTPTTPESPKSVKVGKIFSSPPKVGGFRNSLDSKNKTAAIKETRLSLDSKFTRTLSGSDLQLKKLQNEIQKIDENVSDRFAGHLDESLNERQLESNSQSAEDIRSIIQNENTKTFTNNLVIPEHSHQQNSENTNLSLEANALELDQSILDNINSDYLPEHILLQVASTLVANPELQGVIEKSLVDGGIQLDPSNQTSVGLPSLEQEHYEAQYTKQQLEQLSTSPMVGTQVVRPDGRVVVIPPIERPTTRSRNKKTEVEQIEIPKSRPLDNEHVSGAELDSSSDEEKSDDDPDKLWCICNQPHNNRFMICCDKCEEWYHGKCVNVTKAMGKMMEQEGKDWICLYCKDNSLKRPSAAARRIRKASRNSSTDMSFEEQNKSVELKQPSPNAKSLAPDCLVCGKPSRINSIYCSDPCILQHAKGVERVVVYEKKTGKILTGNSAPSAANLDKWLQDHPNFEAVGPSKPKPSGQLTQSKLKIVKNTGEQGGVSLAVQRRGVEVGVLPHTPTRASPQQKQRHVSGIKVISKQSPTSPRVKLIQPAPLVKNPPATSTPVKTKLVQTQIKPTTPTQAPTVKQPMPQKTPKSRQVEEGSSQLGSKENIRDNVKRTLLEQLMNRLKDANDLKLDKEAVGKISLEIESQLYKCFGDTGQKYRNKYRSLIFNIKDTKNATLWRRICEKSVNPYQLVRLSSDDLASQELALWRERENKHQLDMITKSELEQLGRKSQYVFKTHKGEQELEDDRPTDAVQTTEVITALGSANTSSESLSDHKKDVEKDKKSSKHGRDRSHDSKSKRDKDRKNRKRSHRSTSQDANHHKRSKSKDSHHNSDKNRSRSRDRDRHRKTSHKSSKHKKESSHDITTGRLDKKSKEILEQLVDKQIVPPLEDRLWKHVQQEDITTAPVAESDSDHEPTSTVTIPTPPRVAEIEEHSNQKLETKEDKEEFVSNTSLVSENEEGSKSPPPRTQQDVIWKGTINMVDVAQISITAHEVSGDCSGLGKELPPSLDVVGRISPDTVWDYISKMKCSNSKAISLLRLNATNMEEKMPYIALYSYLSSRSRLGVIKSVNKAVKDFYILPLSNQKPIPQALLPLSGPGFEESRPALLLGIIVRDRRKRPIYPTEPLPTKRFKNDSHYASPPIQSATSNRSYTPPPNLDPRTKRPSIVPSSKVIASPEEEEDYEIEGGDEPYTPEDSDPDSTPQINKDLKSANEISNLILTNTTKASSFLDTGLSSQTFEPFKNKFDSIPGLEETTPNPLEIQRKMEELDQRIALEKAQIQNMSQDIVASSTTSDIGTTALASIALPSNLQQILDSIKGINPPDGTDSNVVKADRSTAAVGGGGPSTDLTIPLLLPKISSRSQTTIPLHIPQTTPARTPLSSKVEKTSDSVLSSLSEEDLMRKAAEMLGETDNEVKPQKTKSVFDPPLIRNLTSTKDSILDMDEPPIPGVGD